MIFKSTTLEDATLIEIEPRGDDRGFFARTFCVDEFAKQGLETRFLQQNISFSKIKGTLRGLHRQSPPHAEVKLIRCLRGAICDVIVDLRPDSKTYMQWQGFELTQSNGLQLYIPEGFAHGFQTLTPDVEMSYLVSAMYAPGAESGARYDDPAFGIDWPLPVVQISEKDQNWPDYTPDQSA